MVLISDSSNSTTYQAGYDELFRLSWLGLFQLVDEGNYTVPVEDAAAVGMKHG